MITWIRTLFGGFIDELRRMARNRSILLVLIGIPVVYPLVVSWLYARNAPIDRPTVLVDHDGSALSQKLAQSLDATQDIAIEGRIADLEQGFEMVRQRKAEMLIFIPSDFSTRIRTGRQGRLKVWVNSANMLTYGAAVGATRTTVAALNEELGRNYFHQQGLTTALADRRIMPIRTDTRMLFYPTGAYGEFLVIGVFLIAFQQLILISLPFSVGLRRETDPGATPGRFPFASLAGRVGAHALFYTLASLFIVLVVTPSFGWGIKSATSVLVLFAALGLAMLPLSMIAASLVRNRYTGFQVLMFVSTPVFMISGFTWPFEQMPRSVQMIASAFPATPALLAMRVLAVKTSDLAAVSGELTWLGAQFVAYTALAVLVTHLVAWRDHRRASAHPVVTIPVV